MRKTIAVLFVVVCMVSMTGCGGSSSATTVTNYTVVPTTTVLPASVPGTKLGGAIQGSPLSFTNYSVSTFAGSSAGFSNYTSTANVSAMFNRPIAVTTDGTNLYVADYLNNAIRQINIVTQHVTTIGNANGLAGSADTAAGTPSFNLPRDITTDGTNLYVADSGNYTIRQIVIATGVVTTIAGAAGQAGSVDSPIGSNARFNVINGITTDGFNLYVTDSNNTIRRIALSGTLPVTTLAGAPGTTGSADGVQGDARFNVPNRLTTDGPNLYVTDFSNSTIRKIVLATGVVSTIAGVVEPGGATGQDVDSASGQNARFNQPNGITTDGTNLYVTDSYNHEIRMIVLPAPGAVYSGAVTTIAGGSTGSAGGSTDGRGAVATFNKPIGITTDGTCLYIADNQNHRIRKIQRGL